MTDVPVFVLAGGSGHGITPELEATLRQLREAGGGKFVLCPRCRCCEMSWNTCWDCGGEGYHELYERDPLYYEEDDTETCLTCRGEGGFYVCDCDEQGRHQAQAEDKATSDD